MATATEFSWKRIEPTSDMDLKEAARACAGNWQEFNCFIWSHARRSDATRWFIFYTHNRDSRLTALSNAAEWDKAMKPFVAGEDPDVMAEDHDAYTSGWVKGYAVRCLDDAGNPTAAFKKVVEFMVTLNEVCALNESDLSQREYDAAHENTAYALTSHKPFNFTRERAAEITPKVMSWFYDNLRAVASVDDQGFFPTDEQLTQALRALNITK